MPDRLRRPRGMMLPALAAALACLAASSGAHAADKPGYPIQCFEDTASRQQYCFAPSKITASGNTRSSPLYKGTGTDLAMTKVVVVADCRKHTIALKDASGAAAKGERAPRPELALALAEDMCAAKSDAKR